MPAPIGPVTVRDRIVELPEMYAQADAFEHMLTGFLTNAAVKFIVPMLHGTWRRVLKAVSIDSMSNYHRLDHFGEHCSSLIQNQCF